MPSSDDARSLLADLPGRWKAELFSADTVVALVAVAVAFPTGVLAGVLVGPTALYAAMFATATGPSLGYWQGLPVEVPYRPAAAVGFVMALAVAVVTTVAVALSLAFDASDGVAVVAGGVVGLLFGGLVGRAAFHRFAGESV